MTTFLRKEQLFDELTIKPDLIREINKGTSYITNSKHYLNTI